MRLDFNIAYVDDNINSISDSGTVNELIAGVEAHISEKGFNHHSYKYESFETCINDNTNKRRIDLYISDNNLEGTKSGIHLYLELQKKFICDFILYTKSNNNEIVAELVRELKEKKDPNLFSRFTFLTVHGQGAWLDGVYKTIDHILTKREELNNLRGLYAQVMSEINNKLDDCLGKKLTLEQSINEAYNIMILKKTNDTHLKGDLHYHRRIRNILLHCNEERDVSGKYTIRCDHTDKEIKEENIAEFRKKLLDMSDRFFQQIED